MPNAIDRSIVGFAVLALVLACWLIAPISGGSLMTQATSATGLALNIVALWSIAWGAPRIVDAVERQAQATARMAAPSVNAQTPVGPPADDSADTAASQLFDAYRRFLTRHPQFARGATPSEFGAMSKAQKRKYRQFLLRSVAFFAAIYDAAGDTHKSKWRQAVWSELDLHDAASREWGDDLGTGDLVRADA